MSYQEYLRSETWQRIRRQRLTFDGYRCQRCGMTTGLEVHHLTYVRLGHEDIADLLTLCQVCHQYYHIGKDSGMEVSLPELRRFQEEFVRLCNQIREGSASPHIILVHAVPGAGKSVLPLLAAHLLIPSHIDKICWAAPRITLIEQAAKQFTDNFWRTTLRHHLFCREAANEEDPSGGNVAYAISHQAIIADAMRNNFHLKEFKKHRYALFLDESHHIYDRSANENAFRPLVAQARYVFLITGSIERADQVPISFLPYESDGAGKPLHVSRKITQDYYVIEYNLESALREKAIIPIDFTYADGATRWLDRNLSQQTKTELLDDPHALYTAVNTEIGQGMLVKCIDDWKKYRARYHASQVLIVCGDTDQAKWALKILRESLRVEADIATYEDSSNAKTQLTRFRKRELSALVTVAMAYEGMDAPSVTHLCCLTHIRSFNWLYQMFGRVWRVDRERPYAHQKGYAYVPNDSLMAQVTATIKVLRDKARLRNSPLDDDLLDETNIGPDGERTTEHDRIIPLSSALTSIHASDISGQSLTPEEFAFYEAERQALNFAGSAIELANIYMRAKASQQTNEQSQSSPNEPPILTPRSQEDKIRQEIRKHISKYEEKNGFDYGTVNTELIKQGWPPRSDIKDTATLLNLLRYVREHYVLR